MKNAEQHRPEADIVDDTIDAVKEGTGINSIERIAKGKSSVAKEVVKVGAAVATGGLLGGLLGGGE